MATLREFSEEGIAGRWDEAEDILVDVPIDEEPDATATSQVIGTGVGLLDEWLAASELSTTLRVVRVPKWQKIPRKIATDLIALARKGRATGSLDSLITRHAGAAVMSGTALAVAAVIARLTEVEDATIAEVADRLLVERGDIVPGQDESTPAEKEPERSPRTVPSGRVDDRTVLRDFRRYTDAPDEIDPDGSSALDNLLKGIPKESAKLSPDAFDAELRELRTVSAVPDLLAWIGRSRPVTQTGRLRRSDIAFAASLLGIAAEGVSTQPDGYRPYLAEKAYVQSMTEVPELELWWNALRNNGVFEVNSTRVEPGPNADKWAENGEIAAEEAAQLIGTVLEQTILDPPGPSLFGERADRSKWTIARLVQILEGAAAPREALGVMHLFTDYPISRLRMLGLLRGSEDDGLEAPPAIRQIMAATIMTLLSGSPACPDDG